MYMYYQYAVAVWEEQYKDQLQKHAKFLSSADKKKRIETPDEAYLVFYWRELKVSSPQLEAFLRDIESLRHAIIGIRDDNMIIEDIMDYDAYGVDEEFNEILGWRADITLWNDDYETLEEAI